MSQNEQTRIFIGYEEPKRKENQITLQTTELHREELEKMTDEIGHPSSRSAVLRSLIELGRHSMAVNDPRNVQQSSDDRAPTIREFVPVGKENAVDIKDELPQIIENNLLEVVEDDSKIIRDGWEVYKEE